MTEKERIELMMKVIKEELVRQSQLPSAGAPYIYNEEPDEMSIDGTIYIRSLAEAIVRSAK